MHTSIHVKCTNQVLSYIETPFIASGDVNEDKIEFEFCPMWEGFTKTAVFYRNEAEVYHVLLEEDDTCLIPHEVLANPGAMYFGVFGNRDDRTKTSEVIQYTIRQGAITEATKISDPTPTIYAQLLTRMEEDAESFSLRSQGRSAKYNFTSGGWKRILNIIRGSNGTVNLGCGTGEWLKYHRSVAFDVCGFVKFPKDTRPNSSPLLIKKFENVCGDDDAMASPPVKITKIRVGYPKKGATFTPINGGTHNYASAPVNCYVDVYVEFDPSNLVNKYATFSMNYAGFADSHNCEPILEETNAADVGIYGEELTYYTVTTEDMPYYLNSNHDLGGDSSEAANALKGRASGNPVVLTDVSPLKHEMSISMSEGGAILRAFGKNLLNMEVFPYFDAPVDGVYTSKKYVGTSYQPLNLPAGEYILSANIKSPKGMNYRLRIKDVDGNTYSLTASEAPSNGEFRYQELKVNVNGIAFVSFFHSGNGAGQTGDVQVKDVQLELGSTATEFEPFVVGATYTADENGEIKATSIYPTTTLIADDGVTVSVEYNKDINKVIENVGENVEPMVESLVAKNMRPRSVGQNTDLSKVKCEYIGEIILKANGFGIGWYDAYICLSISTGLGSDGTYAVYNWTKLN